MAKIAQGAMYRGSVHDFPEFDANQDAEALYTAMKGFGSDKESILARLILGLMMPPAHYDAKQLKKAMEGAGTDEKTLIEILATRTNAEIRAINEAYKEDYHKSLEDALSSDTSGHFRRILISLATGNREEGGENRDQAQEDAQVAAEILEIADTPSGDKTSLETRFMTVLCTRSYPHLRRVFQEFIKKTNYDIEHVIKKEMSGDVKDAFVAIVQSVKNKPLFFADKLYKSMKGAGTDEKTLTRVMVSRSEIDLLNIRREFIEKYDKSLHQAIEGDTSGDFMKGIGTDEATIIDIVTHRSNAQRQQIRQTFKSHFGRDLMADLKSEISGDLITSRSNKQRQEICQNYKSLYGKDLIEDLKYELTGKFERLIVNLMRPLAYCDAKEIKDAISGVGTDEKCLIEILASRTNEQMHQLVAAYKDAYERDLESDIIGDTSGHFQKMLVVLLQGTRENDDVVSEDLVQQDVQDLYEAGELKWGTDEAQFIYILGNRSKQHLRLVFDEYLKTTGKPIEASIRGELSGDFEKLMLAVVKCIRSTPEYFAERLFKAMKGLGTRDNTLIRIMVSRSELDMLDIREIFRTKYEKSLYSMIKNDTSGEYKKALLKLCGGDDDAAGQFFPEAAQVAYQMWELSAVSRVELKGTVCAANDFNPDADAKALRKAMKGIGTDEATIPPHNPA